MAIGTFANRTTYIDFNDYLPSLVTPWVTIGRDASEMCRSTNAVTSNAAYMKGVGWQCKSYHLDAGDSDWLTAAQPGILSSGSGAATIAPYMIEANTFAQQSLSGVTYASGVQAAGTPMIQAQIPAGTSYSANALSADQAAFPSPATGDDSVTLDRVYVGNAGYVNPGDSLIFSLTAPGSSVTPRGTLANFYFNGPASYDADAAANPGANAGTGQYCLKYRGDGRAYLFELLADQATWKPRFSFAWNFNPSPVTNVRITLALVFHMWQDASGNWQGDRITFNQVNFGYNANAAGKGFPVNAVAQAVQAATDIVTQRAAIDAGNVPVYTAPRLKQQACVGCPVRIDVARDCRAKFQVSKFVYYTPATIQDDQVSFDSPIQNSGSAADAVYVYWSGSLPTGTSWNCQLYDQTGTALSVLVALQTVNGAQGQNAGIGFTPSANMTGAYVVFTLSADSTLTKAPTLTGYEIDCAPTYQTVNPIEITTIPAYGTLPKQVICSVEISPQETDAGAENASVVVEDLTGGLSFLNERTMIPIRIYTTYDAGGDEADLFRGYVLQAHGEVRRGDGSRSYPAQQWTKWNLQCVGEWARFYEQTLPTRRSWAAQPAGFPNPGNPWRITDIIGALACTVYPPSMVNVPVNSLQIFSSDAGAMMSDVGTRQADVCAQLAADYLGAYMLFDESAGSKGIFRLLSQKTPPYNNLANFVMQHPTAIAGDGVPRLPQWVLSYPVTTSANGQEVQSVPILAGSYVPHYERPEGNCVITYGATLGADAASQAMPGAGLLTQVAINVSSYNFLNLASTATGFPNGSSPEYLGRMVPIRIFDSTLTTQQAIDWKTRRVYDRSCFARYFLQFTAPLVLVTDVTDAIQVRPRRLRYYDAVTVDVFGTPTQFLVVNCTPTYRKDSVQMARYTLVTTSNINTVGIMPMLSDRVKRTLKWMARMFNLSVDDGIMRQAFARQKQSENLRQTIAGLPQVLAPSLQDLNPLHSTFGEFYQMVDYPGAGPIRA